MALRSLSRISPYFYDRGQLAAMTTFHPTAARNLVIGDIIRLANDRFSPIVSVGFAEDELIGGPKLKTARAIKIATEDGASFTVHPTELIGVRR